MRMAYANLVDLSSSIVATTAVTGYPDENIQNQRVASKYRTATLSGVTITIDLGEYHDEVDTIALIGHNLTSAATVVFDFNYLNSFAGATSQTVTYNAGMMLKYFTPEATEGLDAEDASDLITESGLYLTTEHNYRYLQVQITDAANPDGYIEIGRVWAGSYITVDPSSLLDFRVIKKGSDRVMHFKGRQKLAIIGDGWRRFELSFPPSQDTMIAQVEDMFDYVGNYKALIFCNFDTDRSYELVEPCYCSIEGDIGFQHSDRMKFSYSLSLEEEL